MKIECPVCGVEGYLQQRGNSFRVGHYRGYNSKTGTRIVGWHKITREQLLVVYQRNGNQNMVIKNFKTTLKSQNPSRKENVCPGSIVRSSIGGCRPPDPGSNPGQGAINFVCGLCCFG